MLRLIPSVKTMELKDGFLENPVICYRNLQCDERVLAAIKKLPYDEKGAALGIDISENGGEGYELFIDKTHITIKADSSAGAFYAVQTLRQIFTHKEIPCLYIKDEPDFAYRGFYHDVTRGKIPTVATLKKLIDNMAYYKLNSLQLYVEHTFKCEEYSDLNETFDYYTGEELQELGEYCKQNFIEFIPSLSTFGHLYELLNQDKYKHLRVLKEDTGENFWNSRMRHHTIDPLHPDSMGVIKSLIDQYAPNFESDYFNICCDETFDLKEFEKQGKDVGKIYVDFVKQIISYTKQKGKKVMMWADILLKYPETIDDLPEDIIFLNWDYAAEPKEETVIRFASSNRPQIVCPGTWTWSRLCEDVEIEEQNISKMAEYGYRHGAIGVLNTNWGDWGNPCSLELAMYGLVLGAEKSWSVTTNIDDEFYSRVNHILYENENGMQRLKALSDLHKRADWARFILNYLNYRHHDGDNLRDDVSCEFESLQAGYKAFSELLSKETWGQDEYRQEMLIAAEGLLVLAELDKKMTGESCERLTNTGEWLSRYKEKWLEKNKPSELYRIEEMFTYVEEN